MSARTFDRGARVLVKIAQPSTWVDGAVRAFNGQVGLVREVKPAYYVPSIGRGIGEPLPGYLVFFDRPVESWVERDREGGRVIFAFHFLGEDLEPAPAEVTEPEKLTADVAISVSPALTRTLQHIIVKSRKFTTAGGLPPDGTGFGTGFGKKGG